jgi:hypothetical protein
MIEQIPLFLATPIAKIILDKLYEGVGNKLGEKAIEAVAAPLQKLGQVVWNRCFKEKIGADKVLESAAKGSEPELKQLRDYLSKEMENPEFRDMVQPIAQEIHQLIVQMDDYITMTQINQDSAKGWQTKVEGGTTYIGEIHFHGREP